LAGPAAADDGRREADQHARRGVAYYKLGHYTEAIGEFEQAYVLYPSDTLLYNLGQSYRQLDRCREALDYYRRFLDAQPTSPLAAKVSDLIPPLEHACAVKFEKPVDVDSGPPPVPPPPPEASPHPTDVSPAPEPAPELLRVRGSIGAGVLISGGATGTPIGPEVGLTREIAGGALEIGGQLAAGWFPGAPGTTATAFTARAIALRTVWRGDLDIALGAGAGVLVLESPMLSMVAPSHNIAAAFAVPEIAGLASVRRALSGEWEAALEIEAAAGASADLNGGVAATFGASLSLGYRQ
jgi:tetratricopeptide (TPR) repeat protein